MLNKGITMSNQYISRYAKHDTHFLRTSDKNYYFEQDPIHKTVKVIYAACFIVGLTSLAFLATL